MKNDKRIMLLLILAVGLSLVGCGNTTPVVDENMTVESAEPMESSTATVENMEQMTEATEASSTETKTETKDSEVAEVTPEPTPEPTATPEPTTTPEPTQPPHTHDFKVESTVAATCATEGKVVKVCSCGEKQTEVVPATGNHTWVEEMEVISTPATGHVEEVQVQVGTTRRTEYECAYCGARFDTASGVVDHCVATGDFDHAFARTIAYDYDEPVYETQSTWVVDTLESTSTVGTGKFTCSVCGQQKE